MADRGVVAVLSRALRCLDVYTCGCVPCPAPASTKTPTRTPHPKLKATPGLIWIPAFVGHSTPLDTLFRRCRDNANGFPSLGTAIRGAIPHAMVIGRSCNLVGKIHMWLRAVSSSGLHQDAHENSTSKTKGYSRANLDSGLRWTPHSARYAFSKMSLQRKWMSVTRYCYSRSDSSCDGEWFIQQSSRKNTHVAACRVQLRPPPRRPRELHIQN
jgi:hypothetical protein